MRQGVPVILATGKHRGPWVRRLLDQVPVKLLRPKPLTLALGRWLIQVFKPYPKVIMMD